MGRGGVRAGLLAAALSCGSIQAAERPVELELVLAVDASYSITDAEFALQMRGLVEAFRSPALADALGAAPGGIAVTLLQWSGTAAGAVQAVPWTAISDGTEARAFAQRLAAAGRQVASGPTALGYAIEAAMRLFEANGFAGRRLAIDVSGDGRANQGVPPSLARDRAVAKGIVVNGLAIEAEEPGLLDYYRARVIGGDGAFALAARDHADFAPAILGKLIREITGRPLARHAPADGPASVTFAGSGGSSPPGRDR